jgi:carboxypeptidase family protein/TonB-dependent receptor-like protein
MCSSARKNTVSGGLALFVGLLWMGAASAGAQTTTASIQGTVTDDSGIVPGATVTARETQRGFQFEAVTGTDGAFTLAGLRPGTYEITVAMSQYKPAARTVQVLVGQNVSLDFRITPDLVYVENVTVVGERLVDNRTPEIATNVTEQQVRHLPQNSRNFLNFAALAPGVRVADDETRKEITAGSLGARSTNVYIDGVSYKNDVLEGGVIGQDASRGNPFPQGAVQEFQVVTQNYKAEYEKATSAIITAVTKSGGNTWSGDVFSLYQDKSLVEQDEFAKGRGLPKPTYERWQWGASVGGPIVKDKLQVFGSFEENRQDRDSQVVLGGTTIPASLRGTLTPYQGTFVSPFRERLAFVKLSSQPRSGHLADLTYNLRNETDIRGFGTENSYEAAENVRNRVDSVLGRYQVAAQGWLNEASVSFQRYRWNPSPENPDLIGRLYVGVLRIGGRDTEQLFIQRRISFRDDFSWFTDWGGKHAFKGGAVLGLLDYSVDKKFNYNPLFRFRSDISWDFPFEASFGAGDSSLDANNRQFGLYLQDDWSPTSRLTLNLGVRWDYESDMLNNDYVTPDNVRAAAAPFVDGNRYFTDGGDRAPFYGGFAPRLGFSYDLTGRGRTILFGGAGRHYDRVLYNHTLDERFRLQYAVRLFRFSATGAPRDGQPTLRWDPAYLSAAGLQQVIATGVTGLPEIFLIDNDTRVPSADQFTIGLRHALGPVFMSASYAGVRSRNEFTWLFGTRRPNGQCCLPVPGFANILISSDDKKSWYDALFVTAEKPYGASGKWGFSLTYTLGRAEQNGGDLFSLDFPTPQDYPRYPTATDERHRIVATGIVGLPWDILGSTLVTLGSGLPYNVDDQSRGGGPNERRFQRNGGRPDGTFPYQSVDLRLEKAFRFATRQQVSVIAEAFNVFSHANYKNFDGFIPALPATNANFGKPREVIDPGRRLQFGLRYQF